MHSNNSECSYCCQEPEDQRHLFRGCSKLDYKDNANFYDYIFEDIVKQKEASSNFICIEKRRNKLNLNSHELVESLKLPRGGGANWPPRPSKLTNYNPNAKTDVTLYNQL